jgi:hypothetical protein
MKEQKIHYLWNNWIFYGTKEGILTEVLQMSHVPSNSFRNFWRSSWKKTACLWLLTVLNMQKLMKMF